MKKILLALPVSTLDWGTENKGGVDSVSQMLLKHLTEHKEGSFHYRVLAFDQSSEEAYSGEIIKRTKNVEIVRCPVNEKKIGMPVPGFISCSFRVKQEAIKYEPDIVHSHIESWLLGVPQKYYRLATLHSYKNICRKSVSAINDIIYVKLLPSLAHRYIDSYTCVGDILKKEIQNEVQKPVSIVGNPIEEAYFNEGCKNKISNSLVLVTCALISRRKRIDRAVDLVAALKKKGANVKLKIIGPSVDREYYSELMAKINKLDVNNDVVLLGKLNRNEIIEEYRCSDIGVFFSEQETFGLAPLEMIASGLPLLTTNVGILSEKRKNFENLGVKIIDNDNDNVNKQVDFIRELKQQNTSDLIRYVKSEFSVERVVKNYESLYRSILNV